MKRILAAGAVIVLCVAQFGCADDDDDESTIVGNWESVATIVRQHHELAINDSLTGTLTHYWIGDGDNYTLIESIRSVAVEPQTNGAVIEQDGCAWGHTDDGDCPQDFRMVCTYNTADRLECVANWQHWQRDVAEWIRVGG